LRIVLLSCAGAPFSAELLLELERRRPDLLARICSVLLSQPKVRKINTLPRDRQLLEILRTKGIPGLAKELSAAIGYRLNGLWQRFGEPALRAAGLVEETVRIEAFCERRGIPFTYTRDVNSADTLRHLRALEPDVILIATFNHILQQPAIDAARVATLNVHPSLLPRFRGADPIADALGAGASESGVTVHWVDTGIDTGDIAVQEPVPIPGGCTVPQLRRLLAEGGGRCVERVLMAASAGRIPRRSQA